MAQRRLISPSASGNALFLILIAVALFAALSYAVTQSGRGSGTITRETMALKASAMVQYGAALRVAAQRMILSGATTPATLDLWTTAEYTPCTAGADCIFSPEGGGATAQKLPGLGDMNYFNNDDLWRYAEAGDDFKLEDIGSADGADVFAYAYITMNADGEALCTMINKNLGITGIPGGAADWTAVTDGQPAGCVKHYSSYYIFYYTLVEN